MPRLTRWLRKRINHKDDARPPHTASDPSHMPTLPIPRPRALSLRENSNPQQQSPFFSLLPLELRQKIYLHLFGNRTIHLDFSYDYPDLPGPRHAGLNYGPKKRDFGGEKRWRWWHSVCHRVWGYEWWGDDCRGAYNTCCEWTWKEGGGGRREDCWIYVGWLYCCRQGYIEALPTLYTTNTFYLFGTQLLQQLPTLILPERLANITALDLNWSFAEPPSFTFTFDGEKNNYKTLFELINKSFPLLHTLRVAVATGPCAPANTIVSESLKEIEKAWLGPPDGLIKKYCSKKPLTSSQHRKKQAISLELVIPSSWYETLHRFRREEEFKIPKTFYRRFWRVCSVEDDSLSKVKEVLGGELGERVVDSCAGKGIGYWIRNSPDVMGDLMCCLGT